nr:DNA cytosine methyltransferase [Xylanimonas allomyrinae]
MPVIDLFAGAGGLSRGFHQSSNRYATTRAVEMDLAAAATYAQNFGDVVYVGDILHWLADESTPHADLVLGGPPCQGFSMIGKRDPLDLRNTLWRPYVEVVRRVMPRAFVMENVPAFLRSGSTPRSWRRSRAASCATTRSGQRSSTLPSSAHRRSASA